MPKTKRYFRFRCILIFSHGVTHLILPDVSHKLNSTRWSSSSRQAV